MYKLHRTSASAFTMKTALTIDLDNAQFKETV